MTSVQPAEEGANQSSLEQSLLKLRQLEKSFNLINQNLAWGDPDGVHDAEQNGFDTVLNVADDAQTPQTSMKVYRVPLSNYVNQVTPDEFNKAVSTLVQLVGAGSKVFVHCAKGRKRSASVIAGYLMKTGMSEEAAVAEVKKIEPNATPIRAWLGMVKGLEEGGPGSGHHGHSGVPGQRGGSAPGEGSSRTTSSNPKFKLAVESDQRKGFIEKSLQNMPNKYKDQLVGNLRVIDLTEYGRIGATARAADVSRSGDNEIWVGDFRDSKLNGDSDYLAGVVLHENTHLTEEPGLDIKTAETRAYTAQANYYKSLGRDDLYRLTMTQITTGSIIGQSEYKEETAGFCHYYMEEFDSSIKTLKGMYPPNPQPAGMNYGGFTMPKLQPEMPQTYQDAVGQTKLKPDQYPKQNYPGELMPSRDRIVNNQDNQEMITNALESYGFQQMQDMPGVWRYEHPMTSTSARVQFSNDGNGLVHFFDRDQRMMFAVDNYTELNDMLNSAYGDYYMKRPEDGTFSPVPSSNNPDQVYQTLDDSVKALKGLEFGSAVDRLRKLANKVDMELNEEAYPGHPGRPGQRGGSSTGQQTLAGPTEPHVPTTESVATRLPTPGSGQIDPAQTHLEEGDFDSAVEQERGEHPELDDEALRNLVIDHINAGEFDEKYGKEEGGAGSGHYGHQGTPGQRGGSKPSEGTTGRTGAPSAPTWARAPPWAQAPKWKGKQYSDFGPGIATDQKFTPMPQIQDVGEEEFLQALESLRQQARARGENPSENPAANISNLMVPSDEKPTPVFNQKGLDPVDVALTIADEFPGRWIKCENCDKEIGTYQKCPRCEHPYCRKCYQLHKIRHEALTK